MTGNSNNETNFSHQLLAIDRQVSKFHRDFPNNLLNKINLSKTQLSKLINSDLFLGSLFGPLKTGLPMMKIVLHLLTTNVFLPLRLAPIASAADAGIWKKNHMTNDSIFNFKWRNGRYHKIVRSLNFRVYWWKLQVEQLKTKQKNKNLGDFALYLLP